MVKYFITSDQAFGTWQADIFHCHRKKKYSAKLIPILCRKKIVCLSLTPGVKISPLLRAHYHHTITGRVGTVYLLHIFYLWVPPSGAVRIKNRELRNLWLFHFFRVTFSFAFFVCFYLRTFALSLLNVFILHFLRSGFVSLIIFSEPR